MCTAISYITKDHYFGRNLDLEYHYNEEVTVTPRNYKFRFRQTGQCDTHYAMIGIATVEDGYPLYYDATNEHGLSAAGLNFPGNAAYHPPLENTYNVASFEFIPWILCQCKTLKEARLLLNRVNITDEPFNSAFPPSPLHWMICDATACIVVEPMKDGIHIYENPVGVLTNNPPFPYHMYNLQNYINLTSEEPTNRFAKSLELAPYSRGMGAMGLPGDLSSASRFVRAAFTKCNSVSSASQDDSISQFFHILGSVAQQQGCVKINEKYEKTVYTSCCNTDKGVYYYTTYQNSQITAVNMHSSDINGKRLTQFPLKTSQQIFYENKTPAK